MMRFKLTIASRDHLLVSIDDFHLAAGKITVLFGESGIGKTLIAQALFGLLDPYELHIEINGRDYQSYLRSHELHRLQSDGFFVFQEPSTHLNPLMTLEEQLNEGALKRAGRQEQILQALWQKPYASHIRPLLSVYPKPYRPSGGEKQRILLAMAFKKWAMPCKNKDRLFIFDEPTGSLDNRYRDIFLKELLRRYREQPFTVLLITHDYSMISAFTEHHATLLPHIYFKELRRQNTALVKLLDFKPAAYTDWLARQHPASGLRTSDQSPVLKITPKFKVFDKTFFLKLGHPQAPANPLLLHKGDLVYLKAPSGMGKTTLAKIIAGLQRAQEVHFELGGLSFDTHTPIAVWRKYIWGKKLAMVFQHADEALNLQALVRDIFKGLPGVTLKEPEEMLQALRAIFDDTLAPSFLKQKVGYLSGGQKQRLNLLRALLLHPEVIILDEPLNGLDFESIRKVIEIIERKMAAGSGVLLISHNEEIFDRIVPENKRYYLTEAWEPEKKTTENDGAGINEKRLKR